MGAGDSLGLIAGAGGLPLHIAADARAKGRRVYVVALDTKARDALAPMAEEICSHNPGKLAKVFEFFKERGVREAVLAGKVSKTILYDGTLMPDMRAASFIMKLADRRDDTIINRLAREFEKEGIALLDMKEFCAGLLAPEGHIAGAALTDAEAGDVEFGFRMAKEIGRLDIGQTVVVKDLAVMAVEAIEGTDEAIGRGGALAGGGAVVVKVSRPAQDMRFDVPAAGTDTLSAMLSSGAGVLALEAGKSIIIGREEFVRKAEEAGIKVVGVKEA